MEIFIWLGIAFCALNAATFSGLNLAYFSVPVLRLKVLAKKKDPEALKVLALRNQPNFLLATILWSNVSYNVLLALLANSVMAGLVSFFFSTIVLTLVGEIMPQATFSRKALKYGALFAPMMRFYQVVLLYPIAKPTALALNYFLGKESPSYYSEQDLISLIEEHLDPSNELDISSLEGRGAISFLQLDDRLIRSVGRKLKQNEITELNFKAGRLLKFDYAPHPSDGFIKKILGSHSQHQILVDSQNEPKLVLLKDLFVKAIFSQQEAVNVRDYCVKPVVVISEKSTVAEVMKHFANNVSNTETVVLYWAKNEKRLLVADDLLNLLIRESENL